MPRALKVYGWTEWYRHAPPKPNGNQQVRMIVAAHSKAEAARIAGYKSPARMWNLCDTGNVTEITAATMQPEVVLWRPMDDYSTDLSKFKTVNRVT